MKLVKLALTPPLVAISVALCAALSSFGGTTYNVTTVDGLTNAITNAGDGDEIVVSGTLTFAANASYSLTHEVTLRGATTDAADTVLDMSKKTVRFDVDNAKAVIRDLTFKNSGGDGKDHGVVKIGTNGGLVANCVFDGLSTTGEGPMGVYLNGGRVTGCSFLNGTICKGTAGASVKAASAMLDHCVFKNFSVSRDWAYGLIQLTAGTVSDCLIVKNTIVRGLVEVDGDNAVLRNCTIVGNKSTYSNTSGGIYWSQKTGARIVNCIVAGNVNKSGAASDIYKTGDGKDADLPTVFLNNCVQGLDIGTACQTVSSVDDIKFADAAAGDYNLLRGSPAIDHGTDAQGLSETDLAGNVRAMGDRVDIGAYEYNPRECDFTVDVTNGLLTTVFHFTSIARGCSGSQTYLWTFTHGATGESTTSTDVNPEFTPWDLGTYTVNLTVTDGSAVVEKTADSFLNVIELSCDFTANATEGASGSVFHFTATTSVRCEDVEYLWTFRNGATGASETSTDAEPDFTASDLGQITVTLQLKTEFGTVSAEKENYINVQSKICFVDADNETPEFPYDTKATAANTLADAYAACGSGGEIVFVEKTKDIAYSGELTISRGVTVRGENADRTKGVLKFENNAWIVLDNAGAILKDLTIKDGVRSSIERGRVKITANGGLVTNCVFRNVTATKGPSDVYMLGGRVTGSVFYGNGSRDSYGAMYINGADALFDHNVISNCSYQSGGTGIAGGLLYLANGTVSDCLIVGNRMYTKNGVVCVDGDGAVLRNCTISGNAADQGGGAGGVYWSQKTGARIVNTIIAGNTSVSGTDPEIKKSGTGKDADLPTVFLNNCVLGLDIGTGCQKVDSVEEVFVDAAANDFTLVGGSPAIENGTDALGLSETDLAGNPRVMGDRVDIGAFAYDPGNLTCKILTTYTEGFVGMEFALACSATGIKGDETYAWRIVCGETVVLSSEANPTVTLPACGKYDVSLTVTTASSEASDARAQLLYAAPHDIYVRWNASAPSYPFATPETATTNASDAVEAAIDGTTVHVEGTNIATRIVTVDRQIVLEGASGYAADRIRQTVPGRVVTLNNAAAVVRGLAFSGGKGNAQYYSGAGVNIGANGGLMEDCLIEDNSNGDHYSSGGGLYINRAATGAIVRRCIVRNNYLYSGNFAPEKDTAAGGAGACLLAGTVENCLFTGNTGFETKGGGVLVGSPNVVLRNCTIAGNHASKKGATDKGCIGGGLFIARTALADGSPSIVNCLITGNYNYDPETPENWAVQDGAATENLPASFTTCAFTEGELPVADDETKVMLVTDPGFAKDGSYRLKTKTGLRGKGTYQAWMDGTTDLYGHFRANALKEVAVGCCEPDPIRGLRIIVR